MPTKAQIAAAAALAAADDNASYNAAADAANAADAAADDIQAIEDDAARDVAFDAANAAATLAAFDKSAADLQAIADLSAADSTAPESEPMQIELSPAAAAALADVEQIRAALDATPVTSVLHAITAAALATAIAALDALVAADATDTERLDLIDAAHAGVLALPESIRAAALDAALAAINAKYAPTPDVAADVPDAAPAATRTLNPRTIERNAAVAADPNAGTVGAAYLAAFDKSDAADCLAHRDAGTRYPSFVPLARSGIGVADAGEYRTAATAVRLYMRSIGYAGVGNSVAESAWLARRNQYAPNGKKSGEYGAKCFHSGASIALYADGRFRLAAPGTVGVRWLSTDNAAWNMFIGASNSVQTTLDAAPLQTGQLSLDAAVANVPTPPNQAANPLTGALTATAKCVHCNASNLSTANVCRACRKYPRLDDSNGGPDAPDANGAVGN